MKSKVSSVLSKNIIFIPLLGVAAILVGFAGVSAFSTKSRPAGRNCSGICVNMTSQGMEPNEFAIKTGEFVQFNSADGKKHNISLGEGAGGEEKVDHGPHGAKHEHDASLASGDIAPDEAWRVQFKKPGTYKLHDHYNPSLNILVVVYD